MVRWIQDVRIAQKFLAGIRILALLKAALTVGIIVFTALELRQARPAKP